MRSSSAGNFNRREFIKRSGIAVGAASLGVVPNLQAAAASTANGVSLIADPADPVASTAPVGWALAQLQEALTARGVAVRLRARIEDAALGDLCVVAASRSASLAQEQLSRAKVTLPDAAESLALVPGKAGGKSLLLACGQDARGLVYALLELADRVTHAERPLDGLAIRQPIVEKPANKIRSVTRLFVSDVEDKPWYYDRDFWRRYLTMLAAQRFNRFNLAFGIGYDFVSDIRDCYFHFAYPFLVSPPGYTVRADPLPDEERERNLETLRFISEETAKRGMHFQLGLWTHAYSWPANRPANYRIQGLTAETHAPYCRDALMALLQACPAISGLTFRIHGESGVAEGSFEFWKTIFDGAVKCGRRIEIDMHAKGMDEQMTRVAVATGLPVNISPKFWAEHAGLPYMQGAIRPLEMPAPNARGSGLMALSSGSRSFLRYGYGDLLDENRQYGVLHRLWPGTQRVLLWGDPALAADYGRASSFCGSVGVELMEPLSFKGRKGSGLPGGRDGYADASLRPAGGDFEKYLYTYRVWGRCIYNPDCEPEVWRRWLRKQFGAGALPAEDALSQATQILPLVTTAHCPSAANNDYWPEMYTNMPIVDPRKPHPYGDSPSPRRFGTVSSLDPEFFLRIDDYADELLQGKLGAKYSPAWVAQSLLNLSANAEKSLAQAKARVSQPQGVEFRRLDVDVAMQIGLGRFFAKKFQAGVLYAIFLRTAHRPALEGALKTYREARETWAGLAERARNVYRSDITVGYAKQLRGHWLDRLPAIDDDISDMEKRLHEPPETASAPLKVEPKTIELAMRAVLDPPQDRRAPVLAKFHTPSKSFRRSEPLVVETSLAQSKGVPKLASIQLRYRRVNQAELWQQVEMGKADAGYRATIPSEYTNSPFPLQYHFELRPVTGAAWLHPGLRPSGMTQPYHVVRQAA